MSLQANGKQCFFKLGQWHEAIFITFISILGVAFHVKFEIYSSSFSIVHGSMSSKLDS
jgi:hypothetical protein